MTIQDQQPASSSSTRAAASPATRGPARPEAATPRANPAARPGAGIEPSVLSLELRRALEAAHAAADVRAEKVAGARERIARGVYRVNAGLVARGVLGARA
jgi:flagellar biosynthesis anti-sigma factor FlgM